MISATVVADSVSPQGVRLTTMKLRYPWFIHGELMTHRVFSRNASSNRAIPVNKMLEEARNDGLRAEPVRFPSEQKGMQGGDDVSDQNFARSAWRVAAMSAAINAEAMVGIGVHKSIINRILQPFTHANVIVTATDWENFFGLRLHGDAEPTMRALAETMWEARKKSMPREVGIGNWHLPFVDQEDIDMLLLPGNLEGLSPHEQMLRVSVARCARVSYESFETNRRSTIKEDLRLYDRLMGAQPLHASPAEHQATPLGRRDEYEGNIYSRDWEVHSAQQGNLRGWRQYRKMLDGEAVAPLPEGYR